MTLQRTVEKRGTNMWTGLNWFRARFDGGILWIWRWLFGIRWRIYCQL